EPAGVEDEARLRELALGRDAEACLQEVAAPRRVRRVDFELRGRHLRLDGRRALPEDVRDPEHRAEGDRGEGAPPRPDLEPSHPFEVAVPPEPQRIRHVGHGLTRLPPRPTRKRSPMFVTGFPGRRDDAPDTRTAGSGLGAATAHVYT